MIVLNRQRCLVLLCAAMFLSLKYDELRSIQNISNTLRSIQQELSSNLDGPSQQQQQQQQGKTSQQLVVIPTSKDTDIQLLTQLLQQLPKEPTGDEEYCLHFKNNNNRNSSVKNDSSTTNSTPPDHRRTADVDVSSYYPPSFVCSPARDLMACTDLHHVPGVKVIQRHDLFQVDKGEEALELGTVVFHRPDAEWLTESWILDPWHDDAYEVFGRAIRDALNCTSRHNTRTRTRSADANTTGADIAIDSITNHATDDCSKREDCKCHSSPMPVENSPLTETEHDNMTGSVNNQHQQHRDNSSSSSVVRVKALNPSGFYNTATPSVAIIRKAFAGTKSGRIQTRSHVFQFNQCGTGVVPLKPLVSCDAQFESDDNNSSSSSWRKNVTELVSAKHVFGKVVFVGGLFANAHYHAFVEHFARLALVVDLLEDDPDIMIVAPKPVPLYAKQIYGIGPERFVTFGGELTFYADTIYVPDPVRCGLIDPPVADITRNAIHKAIRGTMAASTITTSTSPSSSTTILTKNDTSTASAPPSDDYSMNAAAGSANETSATTTTHTVANNDKEEHEEKKIIVPQQQRPDEKHILIIRRRGSREITNHDEFVSQLRQSLSSRLQPVGGEEEKIVIFDAYNLPPPGLPQLEVFANAKLIVAPHGAGLAYLLACTPGTAVVEFLQPGAGMGTLVYLWMASVLNLEYHPLRMYPTEEAGLKGRAPLKAAKYTIDVPRVVDIVITILQGTPWW